MVWKCRRFQKVYGKRCVDFVGGKKGVRGQPGKKCKRFKRVKTKVCADFGPRGAGKLPKEVREKIRGAVRIGAFGGKGTMASLETCKSQVRSQKARGVPYANVSKRLTLISTWNKRKNPELSRRAKSCRSYAKEIY